VQQADAVIHAGFTLDMMQTLTGFLMTQIATAVATYSIAEHRNQGFACGCSTSGCGVETAGKVPPLGNMPEFGEAFSSKKGQTMRPVDVCNVS
jgi:hypothetical protein